MSVITSLPLRAREGRIINRLRRKELDQINSELKFAWALVFTFLSLNNHMTIIPRIKGTMIMPEILDKIAAAAAKAERDR